MFTQGQLQNDEARRGVETSTRASRDATPSRAARRRRRWGAAVVVIAAQLVVALVVVTLPGSASPSTSEERSAAVSTRVLGGGTRPLAVMRTSTRSDVSHGATRPSPRPDEATTRSTSTPARTTRATDATTSTTSSTATAPTTTTPTTAPAPTLVNPSANVAPTPDFLVAGPCSGTTGAETCANPCVDASGAFSTGSQSAACDAYVLQAIDVARSDEGLAAMVLPSNWSSLSIGQQLFVVANLERTARGLAPYLGINATLSAEAQRAAAAGTDPGLAAGFPVGVDAQGDLAYGGAWAGGFSVLAADYVWMYDDGWGGSAAATPNLECTSPAAVGCWGHRDELLGYDPRYNPGVGLDCTDCEFGVGNATWGSSDSFVDLVERPAGAPPAMTFTWSEELAEGA